MEFKLVRPLFGTCLARFAKSSPSDFISLENHDQPRVVTRFTSDHPEDRVKGSKLMSMFHCALTGTLFIYQGQEIGMCNVPRDWEEKEYIDIETIMNMEGERAHRRKTTGVKDPSMNDMLSSYRVTARDNGRTPMQVRAVRLWS